MPEKPSYEELEQRVKELEKEAVEGKRAEEAQRRVAQLELIYEVGQRIISKLEPETLLSEVVNSVHDGFDYYGVMLMLVDEKTNRLTMQSIAGGYANLFPKDLWLAIGEGMIGYAAETGETQLSGGVSKHPHYVRKAKEETNSELAVPIKSKQKVIAVLDLQSNEFDAFDDTDVMVMETLADQIAVAIENAQLYEAVQQELAERKQTEEALRESEERHRKLFEEAQDGIVLAEAETGVIVDCNYEATKLVSRDKSELIGQHQTILHPPHQVNEEVSETFQKHFRECEGQVLETQVITSTGEIKEVAIKANLLHIGDRKLLQGIFRDISEQKQAEKALKESEEKYRTLFGKASQAIYVAQDGKIKFANPKTEELYGYSAEELTPQPFTYFIHEEDQKIVSERHKKQLRSEVLPNTYTFRIINKAGDTKWVEINGAPFSWDDRPATLCFLTDITERKQAEAELTQTKNFLQNILDSSIDGITTTDLQGKIIYASPRTEDILGYKQKETISKKAYSLYGNGIKDAKTIMKELTVKGELRDHEMKFIRKNGEFIDINLSASLLRNEEGEIIGTLGIYRDITEKNMLENQLAQAQKMEALGTLAGGIAHNFNNLLMGIQGNASLMLLETDPAHPNYQKLKTIEKSVQSGSRLTRQLLGYAREGKYEIKPISLNQLVKETSDTFSMTKKEIRIHLELAQDLCGIKADQGQIEQVLLNLYVNATDAMSGGGDLFLKTINVKHKDIKKKPFKAKPGNYALLSIRDTGVGMDEETMKHIFEPFFTTKGLAKGTGLGLASTYGIIKAHGGYIDVDSEKGHGTTFYVYLPASKKRLEKPIKSKDQIIKGRGAILLVDDEEIVLDASFNMLKRLGYTVFKAKGGREGVEIYKENKDTITMVLLDIIMPDMSGGQVYDRMKEIDPGIKVLLSSGYNIEGQATEILERGCDGFIQKPFNMNELSQSISEILGKE